MTSVSRFKYIAFYDLDHTILENNSASDLISEARRKGIINKKQFRHAVWLSILYKLEIGDSTKMIIRMLSWFKGLNEESITQLCTEVFNELIIHKIRPEIIKTIEEHRSRNGAIVLLSSASEPICRPATEYLKMDDLICSKLESKAGVLTGKTIDNLVYGEEKRTRLLSYCKMHQKNPADAFYYGDSFTDYHVMAAVGHPVAVNPDKKLCRIALKNNWPILIRKRA